MPPRTPDTRLATTFIPTEHSHPAPSIDPLKNKLPTPLNVCIIGASRGIGAGIVDAYAKALPPGSTLVLAARQSSAPQVALVSERAQEINPAIEILSLPIDIIASSSVGKFAADLKQKVKSLDIVVLNSGYSGPVVLNVTEGNPQDFQDVFDVNVQGTYLVAHHLLPFLISSNGAKQFLVVSSFAALITSGHIANAAYCISKFAQMRIVEFLSGQYGREEDGGVVSVAVHPGSVLTEMADSTVPDSYRDCESLSFTLLSAKNGPNRRVDLTDDVGLCGAFCVWLSRDRKTWLNGRLVSAKWDVDELEAKKEEIEGGDLLKLGFRV
ncbi:NAD(P)-binding protein [Massarina eburnea CBS 473.64]|uniref:NAD(P)-binding protein n=1 Tax=Massarina eburnea CBS 473.64 TaxID=1395130 RepID=A0A6A6RT82_9PLEO|nr:NAD(P)-binding protein [Massarina eburnea CBS 473.64]